MGKYEDAIPYYQKAQKDIPGYWRLNVDLAACYSALGRMDEAKEQVQHILKASPNFSIDFFINKLPARRPEDIKPYIDAVRKIPLAEQ